MRALSSQLQGGKLHRLNSNGPSPRNPTMQVHPGLQLGYLKDPTVK